MGDSSFDCMLAWRYLKEKRFDLAEELIDRYKKELEQMALDHQHSIGKADALSIYGYYKCVHLGQKKSGLSFCERAIQRHPENPHHYLVLGMAWFALGFPNKALEILETGNRIAPGYEPIFEGFREVERRRLPVFSFLSRDHRINILMGKIRHRISGPKIKVGSEVEKDFSD